MTLKTARKYWKQKSAHFPWAQSPQKEAKHTNNMGWLRARRSRAKVKCIAHERWFSDRRSQRDLLTKLWSPIAIRSRKKIAHALPACHQTVFEKVFPVYRRGSTKIFLRQLCARIVPFFIGHFELYKDRDNHINCNISIDHKSTGIYSFYHLF